MWCPSAGPAVQHVLAAAGFPLWEGQAAYQTGRRNGIERPVAQRLTLSGSGVGHVVEVGREVCRQTKRLGCVPMWFFFDFFFHSFFLSSFVAPWLSFLVLHGSTVDTDPHTPPPHLTQAMSDSKELSHPMIKDGWFAEISDTMWPGQAMSLRVKKVLNAEQTKYQDLLVFESTDYGNVLVLDGAIQATERDEFAYQEMIAHLALNSHPDPKKVLVIGGGDGGVLREILKHDGVEEAVLCDIDEGVIRNAKKYLPNMSSSFSHPKVKVHIGDGFKFLADWKNTFDVIITDSSDPEGPAASLFEKPYFELLSDALTEKGVITTQAESIWIHLEIIKNLKTACKAVFPNVDYAYCTIPTYPSGQIGFMVCSKNKEVNLKAPLRSADPETEKKLYRYYSKEIHEASFVLPNFAKYALE